MSCPAGHPDSWGLTAKQRAAIEAYILRGSIKAAAYDLGIAIPTAHAVLRRAVDHLRDAWPAVNCTLMVLAYDRAVKPTEHLQAQPQGAQP